MLKRFLVWLLRDERPILLTNGRTVDRTAEFHAETRGARKKRLRALREKKKKGLLSEVERQILDGLELSSVYSNKFASITHQKSPQRRASNIEEVKRLYVAKLVYRKLCPGKDPYEFLERNTRYEKAGPRALEMKLREFQKQHIDSGQMTCHRVVEEQFERFKSFSVQREMGSPPDSPSPISLQGLNPFWILRFAPHLLTAAGSNQPAQRMAWMKAQGARMAFTDFDRALLASLCE